MCAANNPAANNPAAHVDRTIYDDAVTCPVCRDVLGLTRGYRAP